jgi:hypothetical protein
VWRHTWRKNLVNCAVLTCLIDGYYCCVVDRLFWGCVIVVCTVCKVIGLFHLAEASPFCNSYYLFTLPFLSKQTRHGRNIVSFYFFLFRCGRAKCLSREQCVAALCSSCSSQKYLERWPAASKEAGRSVLTLMMGPMIPRIELHTVHLYPHYSLFMHNKLQFTWRGDYCECVRPA